MNQGDRSSRDWHERTAQQRPPIVLTPADRDKLLALIRELPVSAHAQSAEFLREEVERADVAMGDISPTLVVRMGSDVKFIDHEDQRIHRARLVFPEEGPGPRFISVLSPVGSALIGLGPGQSIRWTEARGERRLTVLEVSGDAFIPSGRRRRE
ncbi:GreA/GreB family elongation factor [Pseudorhodoplanes sp.]|jgi:regulator of nucleoside diphosphate kinase|uniref:GreA/GreB family elongation factor n=1 Tax=Pseudorhodoplanes sp. TaxID=1934341 RepID=UPI003D115AFF